MLRRRAVPRFITRPKVTIVHYYEEVIGVWVWWLEVADVVF